MKQKQRRLIIKGDAIALVEELARLSTSYTVDSLANVMQWDIDDFLRRCAVLRQQVDSQTYCD